MEGAMLQENSGLATLWNGAVKPTKKLPAAGTRSTQLENIVLEVVTVCRGTSSEDRSYLYEECSNHTIQKSLSIER